MFKTKLCLSTSDQFGISTEEQIRLFHTIGFEGFFTGFEDNIPHLKRVADELGMMYQSVHAPFVNAAKMWESENVAKEAVDELIECVKMCAENDIKIMVAHAFIGFESHEPNQIGIKNFEKVAKEAQRLGVKLALENTEGEEYLKALMDGLKGYDNVGFCWDTGHEMCYNQSRDMMSLYGDRIICTHLNDNLGIRDFNGTITWIDDLHLLPFDGIADWNDIVARLNKYNYNDMLVFELNKKSKPNRFENDLYDKMTIEEYVTEIYKRACRVAWMKLKACV